MYMYVSSITSSRRLNLSSFNVKRLNNGIILAALEPEYQLEDLQSYSASPCGMALLQSPLS